MAMLTSFHFDIDLSRHSLSKVLGQLGEWAVMYLAAQVRQTPPLLPPVSRRLLRHQTTW
jgi:hypothetical protein